ncbi:MAG: ABC transporter substrate-binding protein [Halanaerobiaceae bacterium]
MKVKTGFKSIVIGLVLIVLFSFAVGAEEIEKINIQSPTTISVLPVLWMAENDIMGDRVEINVDISPDHQRAIALISKDQIDMMITGVNVGAKGFNRGIDIKLLNSNIWAVDYLLTRGFKADSWEELKGKTLSLPLKGGPLDFLARYLMIENGVDPEEVELIYKPLSAGAKTFQLGNLDSIILPEPLVTITLNKTENAHLSLDIQEEWGKLHQGESRIPYVGLFVNGSFAEEKEELVERFDNNYKKGIEWVHANPEEAAELAAEYFGLPASVIRASFDRVNLNCYPEAEAFQLIESYFNEIIEMYPEMIGGRLPNEHFYF